MARKKTYPPAAPAGSTDMTTPHPTGMPHNAGKGAMRGHNTGKGAMKSNDTKMGNKGPTSAC